MMDPSSDDIDPDDELVQELPIFLSHDLTPNLYVLQSPLRPPHRSYDDLGPLVSAQIKPLQKKLQFTYRIRPQQMDGDDSEFNRNSRRVKSELDSSSSSASSFSSSQDHPANYDPSHESGASMMTLTAKPTGPKTNYCIGVLRSGQLHLTPVHAICRMKTDFDYIDKQNQQQQQEMEKLRQEIAAERARAESEWDDDEGAEEVEEKKEEKLRPVLMKFKKKPTERSLAYQQKTYAHLVSMEEKESYVPLHVHPQHSNASLSEFEKLVCTSARAVPFNVPANNFMAYINPTHIDPLTAATAAAASASSSNSPSPNGPPIASALASSAVALDSPHLTLLDRLWFLLRNAKVLRYDLICEKLNVVQTAPKNSASEREILKGLETYAHCVRGCWVVKSRVLMHTSANTKDDFVPLQTTSSSSLSSSSSSGSASLKGSTSSNSSNRVEACRDYLICHFWKYRTLIRSDLTFLSRLDVDTATEMLSGLAKKVTGGSAQGQWEFLYEDDIEFGKRFKEVMEAQEKVMAEMKIRLEWTLEAAYEEASTSDGTSTSDPIGGSGERQSSELYQFIHQLMIKQGVISISYLLHQLKRSSSSSLSSLPSAAVESSLKSSFLPLTSTLYIRRSLHHPAIDRYRRVVAALFSRSNRVKKSEVMRSVRDAYGGEEIPDGLYRKVMSEFAVFEKTGLGSWQLKTGTYE